MNLPFFAVEAYVPGGVQNQAEKNSKNAFRPVPVQKVTFPGLCTLSKGLVAQSILCAVTARDGLCACCAWWSENHQFR